MKYSTPRQRLKVYEKMLIRWGDMRLGYCCLLSDIYDDFIYNEFNFLKELNKYKPKRYETYWWSLGYIGIKKRYSTLLKAIEDTKKIIQEQDRVKSKKRKLVLK